jgi:hypothetical protein
MSDGIERSRKREDSTRRNLPYPRTMLISVKLSVDERVRDKDCYSVSYDVIYAG